MDEKEAEKTYAESCSVTSVPILSYVSTEQSEKRCSQSAVVEELSLGSFFLSFVQIRKFDFSPPLPWRNDSRSGKNS